MHISNGADDKPIVDSFRQRFLVNLSIGGEIDLMPYRLFFRFFLFRFVFI